MANIYLISSGAGTDAPGIIWDGHKFKRIPGWNPEAMVELTHAINIISQAGRLKTPGLAEAAAKIVTELVDKEFAAHVQGGGIVVIH